MNEFVVALGGLDELRAVVVGEVLVDGDAGYPEAGRVMMNAGRPRVVVRCVGAGDVVAALRYAEGNDLPVAVRSGGHHAAGFGTNDGGVVIDVRGMDDVRVLPDDVVRVGTGATWGHVAGRLGELGLAISSGDTASVGVGGLMAGGGIGWMVRKHGLAIDNVVGAEVVTADGAVRRVDAATEPELFWGLRGAAGGLGVVTSYDITAVRQPTVHFGTLLYPWTQAEQVLKGWSEYAADAPEGLTSSLQLAPTMMADRQVPLAIQLCSTDEALLEPLRHLGSLITEKVAEVPYADVFVDMAMPSEWRPRIRNGFYATWSDALTTKLLEARPRIPGLAIEIRALGGAYGAMPADGTAFAHRDARFLVNSVLMGSPGQQGPQQPKDFDALWRSLEPDGAYLNFLSDPTEADLDACFPEPHRKRLAALKQSVDPGHVFRNPLTVPPRPEWTGGRRHLMRWAMRSRR
ncbi:FAD/FMN-containing dehydrogenase [Kribbella aluminosa]|uniref:FAD/FMN-containing dehydrogenase n=1 Tax=Kribbella aluminosa TaxID=416017 RepID=A0ABS4UZZ6_9ACTN|nr:FAD-binding oxidoreductase [Kribbella aluminosa]MBP2357207.1 FAD/FMN-containing dehydrogenase [Kribbella aluminosa]